MVVYITVTVLNTQRNFFFQFENHSLNINASLIIYYIFFHINHYKNTPLGAGNNNLGI